MKLDRLGLAGKLKPPEYSRQMILLTRTAPVLGNTEAAALEAFFRLG
jgi:hypothetical protein